MNRQRTETMAAELGYSVHKGETKFSGYLLVQNATGRKPLGTEYKSSLQEISLYLDKIASDVADIDTGDDVDDIEIESSGLRKTAPKRTFGRDKWPRRHAGELTIAAAVDRDAVVGLRLTPSGAALLATTLPATAA